MSVPFLTRDFVVAVGAGDGGVPTEVSRWHRALGGRPDVWQSRRLSCVVVGPDVQEVTVHGGGVGCRVGCVVVGAPVGFGSLDPGQIARALLAAYATEGIESLRRVDGSFCGVIADESTGRVWLFTDRFGFRKAFATRRAGGGVLASSRAVVLGRGQGAGLDQTGVVQTVLLGHTVGERTLFAGCRALAPAVTCDLVDGSERRYWDIRNHLGERPRDAAADTELIDRFNRGCAEVARLQSVPALNLTGGFDTRAVLSGALRAGRPLHAFTLGREESQTVDLLVAGSGVHHDYIDPETEPDQDALVLFFSLLTDGEWQPGGAARAIRFWTSVSAVAPSGCLHGGLGETWRCYYYKFLWPSPSHIVKDPVAFLVRRLLENQGGALPLLADGWRSRAVDAVREDVEPLWKTVATGETLASVDAFYLLERQRGLTRITSAADIWNPAYAPFGAGCFAEAALKYLGVQNRGESFHRALINRNAPNLAALPIAGGGDARVESVRARGRAVAMHSLKHALGRAAGPGLRAAAGSKPDVARVPVGKEASSGAAMEFIDVRRAVAREEGLCDSRVAAILLVASASVADAERAGACVAALPGAVGKARP